MRPSGRQPYELRDINITRHYTRYAEGSVLIEFGHTKVLCNASFDVGVPRFLKGKGQGWVTAEYGMLPRSTSLRMRREATQNKQGGRTLEIQRFIGRSLRSIVDLTQLGENTLVVDCDVIQADGGTRTAAITGACVALVDALQMAAQKKRVGADSITGRIASVSVGLYKGAPILDLDYAEDSNAETDMNVVMNNAGEFIEIQGTAERGSFSRAQLEAMLALADSGIQALLHYQQTALTDGG